MLVLHGEDLVASRNTLNEMKDKAMSKGLEIISLNGETVGLTEVKQAVESSSLFGVDRVVVIENLSSAKKSQRREEILAYLKKISPKNILVWEGKEITISGLKEIGNPETKLFKIGAEIFKLVDSLKPGNQVVMWQTLDKCLRQGPIELIFFMVCRQIRMLIQVKSGKELLKAAPFVVQKASQQAGFFAMDKLLELHRRLYEIERNQKTGRTPLSLQQDLELWLLLI